MTEGQFDAANYRERCNCHKCQEVKAAIDLLAESYRNMTLNLIDSSGAESISEKIECINQVVQSVMGPDIEKVFKIAVDSEIATIEFCATMIGQVLVNPKPSKNHIN